MRGRVADPPVLMVLVAGKVHWHAARAQLPHWHWKQDHACASSADQGLFLLPEWASIAARQNQQFFMSHLTGLPGPCPCSQGEKDLHCPFALLSCRHAFALWKSNEEEKVITTEFVYSVVSRMK